MQARQSDFQYKVPVSHNLLASLNLLEITNIYMKLAANILLCVLLGTGVISAADWPRFRGQNATGVAPDHAGLPVTWSTTENVRWVALLWIDR